MKSLRAAQMKMTSYEKQLKGLDMAIQALRDQMRHEGCSEENFNETEKIRAAQRSTVEQMIALQEKCKELFGATVKSKTLDWLSSPTRQLVAHNID